MASNMANRVFNLRGKNDDTHLVLNFEEFFEEGEDSSDKATFSIALKDTPKNKAYYDSMIKNQKYALSTVE